MTLVHIVVQGAAELLPVIGLGFSFLAGLVALRWLSSWLEHGRWQYFGYYCLCASAVVFIFRGMGI